MSQSLPMSPQKEICERHLLFLQMFTCELRNKSLPEEISNESVSSKSQVGFIHLYTSSQSDLAEMSYVSTDLIIKFLMRDLYSYNANLILTYENSANYAYIRKYAEHTRTCYAIA